MTGFTGSPIWHLLYSFPPNDFATIERGYEEFAERWGPIIDVFDAEGVRFALEVHPTEIAYDFVTTRKALDAIGDRPGFGINFDPSHLEPQFLDSAAFVDGVRRPHLPRPRQGLQAPARRAHVDPRRRTSTSARPSRGWDFVSPGHGDVDFEALFRALNRIGYQGPLLVEWEDSGMDREWGAADAAPSCAGRTSRRPRWPSTPRSKKRTCPRSASPTARRAARPTRFRASASGMLGYAFMGKAHTNAYRTLGYMTWPPPLVPDLVAIGGRNESAVEEAAERYGFASPVTDWRAIVADDRIGVFDNLAPNNLHAEPTIAAAEAGKHVVCEKPLGRNADEATRRGSACRPPASCTCARSTTGSCPPSASPAR